MVGEIRVIAHVYLTIFRVDGSREGKEDSEEAKTDYLKSWRNTAEKEVKIDD